jgi:hypothetical protein
VPAGSTAGDERVERRADEGFVRDQRIFLTEALARTQLTPVNLFSVQAMKFGQDLFVGVPDTL